jgi:hypothetical protein
MLVMGCRVHVHKGTALNSVGVGTMQLIANLVVVALRIRMSYGGTIADIITVGNRHKTTGMVDNTHGYPEEIIFALWITRAVIAPDFTTATQNYGLLMCTHIFNRTDLHFSIR